MSDMAEEISGLEARMTAALSRIEAGLAKWPVAVETLEFEDTTLPPSGPIEDNSAELAALKAQLEEEQTANAQLEKRVLQIKQRQEESVEAHASEVRALREELGAAEAQAAKMRSANEDMRKALKTLQEQAANGSADAHNINRAMMAELAALRTERAADAAEIDALVATLEPLLEKGAQNA